MASTLDQAAETAKEVMRAAGDAARETGSKISQGLQNSFNDASPTQVSFSKKNLLKLKMRQVRLKL